MDYVIVTSVYVFSGETPNTHLAKRARDLASAYRSSYIWNYFSSSSFARRLLDKELQSLCSRPHIAVLFPLFSLFFSLEFFLGLYLFLGPGPPERHPPPGASYATHRQWSVLVPSVSLKNIEGE